MPKSAEPDKDGKVLNALPTYRHTSDTEEIDAHWYFGGIASMCATVITYPADFIRIQIQGHLQKIKARQAVRIIWKYHGIAGLYYGLASGMQRQLLYAISRFGIYEEARHQGMLDTFWRKVLAAAVSGFLAAFINTPIEKVTVRMRTDLLRPPEFRRKYKSPFYGLVRLYKLGGKKNLFTGVMPAALRGMMMTIGQLSVYSEVKQQLLSTNRFHENFRAYFIASLIAGSIATVLTTPLEVIKLMRMNAEKRKFRNSFDVAQIIIKSHGYMGLYKGVLVSFCFLVPQTVLTFLIYEKMRLRYGIYESDAERQSRKK